MATITMNPSHQFIDITQELDRMAFENSKRGQKEILSSQKTIQEQTDLQVQALNRQGYVYLTVAVIGILCLSGAILGAALDNAAKPPAADANTGTFNIQNIPTTSFAKITEAVKDTLRNSHKELSGFAHTIEHGSQMVTGRLKNPEIRATARVREEEMKIQQRREDNARDRSGAEEIERLRNSMANNDDASKRYGG